MYRLSSNYLARPSWKRTANSMQSLFGSSYTINCLNYLRFSLCDVFYDPFPTKWSTFFPFCKVESLFVACNRRSSDLILPILNHWSHIEDHLSSTYFFLQNVFFWWHLVLADLVGAFFYDLKSFAFSREFFLFLCVTNS